MADKKTTLKDTLETDSVQPINAEALDTLEEKMTPINAKLVLYEPQYSPTRLEKDAENLEEAKRKLEEAKKSDISKKELFVLEVLADPNLSREERSLKLLFGKNLNKVTFEDIKVERQGYVEFEFYQELPNLTIQLLMQTVGRIREDIKEKGSKLEGFQAAKDTQRDIAMVDRLLRYLDQISTDPDRLTQTRKYVYISAGDYFIHNKEVRDLVDKFKEDLSLLHTDISDVPLFQFFSRGKFYTFNSIKAVLERQDTLHRTLTLKLKSEEQKRLQENHTDINLEGRLALAENAAKYLTAMVYKLEKEVVKARGTNPTNLPNSIVTVNKDDLAAVTEPLELFLRAPLMPTNYDLFRDTNLEESVVIAQEKEEFADKNVRTIPKILQPLPGLEKEEEKLKYHELMGDIQYLLHEAYETGAYQELRRASTSEQEESTLIKPITSGGVTGTPLEALGVSANQITRDEERSGVQAYVSTALQNKRVIHLDQLKKERDSGASIRTGAAKYPGFDKLKLNRLEKIAAQKPLEYTSTEEENRE